MTDLKDQFVTQISLGKAHAVALTKEGHIYTFGINNKGQCGRDFTPGASKDGKYCKATKFLRDISAFLFAFFELISDIRQNLGGIGSYKLSVVFRSN